VRERRVTEAVVEVATARVDLREQAGQERHHDDEDDEHRRDPEHRLTAHVRPGVGPEVARLLVDLDGVDHRERRLLQRGDEVRG
jgi:hypothetical protein